MGVKVYLSDSFVSTPMVSMGVLNQKASLGIVITASHNPHTYNGFKLKGDFGGPLLPKDIQEVEDLIPDNNPLNLDLLSDKNIIPVNLEEQYLKKARQFFDGDADRIGLYNSSGEFIDSHHLILLLIHYLVKYKKMTGKVVTAFSCSVKVAKLCEHYNLEHQIVKVGFKYVAEIMLNEDCLLGGEESGGVAIKGHIPERDGIWMGLVIWEYMAKSGKSIESLIQEVYDIVGEFAFERIDLHLDNQKKEEIIEKCKVGFYNSFDDLKIERVEKTDGFKFYFDENSWIMIRPSGTEPVLRTYAEAKTQKECFVILDKVHKCLLKD